MLFILVAIFLFFLSKMGIFAEKETEKFGRKCKNV